MNNERIADLLRQLAAEFDTTGRGGSDDLRPGEGDTEAWEGYCEVDDHGGTRCADQCIKCATSPHQAWDHPTTCPFASCNRPAGHPGFHELEKDEGVTLEESACPTCGYQRRFLTCVDKWEDCWTDGYDPSCCRFPKSCSCTLGKGLPGDWEECPTCNLATPEPEGLTVEELDALPVWSVVQDAHGDYWVRADDCWRCTEGSWTWVASGVVAFAPVRLVHRAPGPNEMVVKGAAMLGPRLMREYADVLLTPDRMNHVAREAASRIFLHLADALEQQARP